MAGNLAVGYFVQWILWKVRVWFKILIDAALTIDELQHSKYLKSEFLDTFKWQ